MDLLLQPLLLLSSQGVHLLLLFQSLPLGAQEVPQLLQCCLVLELVLLPEEGNTPARHPQTGDCTASVSGFSLQS